MVDECKLPEDEPTVGWYLEKAHISLAMATKYTGLRILGSTAQKALNALAAEKPDFEPKKVAEAEKLSQENPGKAYVIVTELVDDWKHKVREDFKRAIRECAKE
jgi:hypothetical protein